MKEYQLQLDQIENNYNRQSLTYSSSTCVTSAEQSGSPDMSATAVSANNSDHSSANNVSNNKISDNNNSNHSTSTTCRTSEYYSDLYLSYASHYCRY